MHGQRKNTNFLKKFEDPYYRYPWVWVDGFSLASTVYSSAGRPKGPGARPRVWRGFRQQVSAPLGPPTPARSSASRVARRPPEHPVYVDVSTGSPFNRTGAATPQPGAPAPLKEKAATGFFPMAAPRPDYLSSGISLPICTAASSITSAILRA